MPNKPALVFVPGAWHDSACYTPTSSVLSSQYGYNVTLVSLPSVGSELRNEPPPQDWNLDVEAIRRAVLAHLDKDEDVILIAHSYGGSPASEAARSLSKKDREGTASIVRLVWISAMALPIGSWMWQKTGGKPARPQMVTIEGDLSYTKDENEWFYNECTPVQVTEARKHIRSLAWKVYLSKTSYQAWKDIPATYLMCEQDHAIPIATQEAMVNMDRERWTVERCDTDHSPFISRVEETVKIIRGAAGEDV